MLLQVQRTLGSYRHVLLPLRLFSLPSFLLLLSACMGDPISIQEKVKSASLFSSFNDTIDNPEISEWDSVDADIAGSSNNLVNGIGLDGTAINNETTPVILREFEAISGQELENNSLNKGEILDFDTQYFYFTATKAEQIWIRLDAMAPDLDISVDGVFYSHGRDSTEWLVVDAQPNQLLNIVLEAKSVGGQYRLSIGNSGRQVMGLSSDEYVLRYSGNMSVNCSIPEKQTHDAVEQIAIINFADRYYQTPDFYSPFTHIRSAVEDVANIDIQYDESYMGSENYAGYSLLLNMMINKSDGLLTGKRTIENIARIDGKTQERCQQTGDIEGNILF